MYAVTADVSSDARFFVATGVLSMLYSIFIIFVYAYLDELYKSKTEIPMADFMLTTIFAVLWLSGSAAWANGTSVLKTVLEPEYLYTKCNHCIINNGGFNGLNTSIVSTLLNLAIIFLMLQINFLIVQIFLTFKVLASYYFLILKVIFEPPKGDYTLFVISADS